MADVRVRDMTFCSARATPRKSRPQSLVWVHRIGTTVGRSVADICRFFIDGGGRSATGGNMAYHYIVLPDRVEQALPLEEQGAHARRWGNAHGIGIAVLGDWNHDRPTRGQWDLAVSVCADLVGLLQAHTYEVREMLPRQLRGRLPVVGHGEVPGTFHASSGKEHPAGRYACPGRYWDMRDFREDIQSEITARSVLRCNRLGHRIQRENDGRAPA